MYKVTYIVNDRKNLWGGKDVAKGKDENIIPAAPFAINYKCLFFSMLLKDSFGQQDWTQQHRLQWLISEHVYGGEHPLSLSFTINTCCGQVVVVKV